MIITFNSFVGTAPKYDDEHLPDGYSVTSHNTKVDDGILEPWALPVSMGTTGRPDTNSMFKYREEWFTWDKVTYAVKAPLKNDNYDYVIIASDGQEPRVAHNLNAEEGSGPYPAVTYPLNVPVPKGITDVEVSDAENWHKEVFEGEDGQVTVPNGYAGTEDIDGDGIVGMMPYDEPSAVEYDYSEVAYSYCYVDAWGRLSALAPPTELIELREWQYTNTTATTLTFPAIPDGVIANDPVRGAQGSIRIFRTNTAASGTGVYQFVAEIPITETEYTDSMYSGDLLDAPLNEAWVGAPDTNTELYPSGALKKVAIMGSDILVGHNKRILCFAEPEAFYAWPVNYYKVFQEDIVTIQPAGANLVVLTTGVPYVVQGVHPDSMDASRLADPVPCSSERGVTEVAGAVYFTSDTGLHRIEGYSIANVSGGFIDNNKWREYDPSTMILANYDNKVFVHCPTAGETLVFDALDKNAGIRTVDLQATGFVQLEASNDLAYVDKNSQELMLFDSSNEGWLPTEWVSKTYLFNDPVTFNIAKVRANKFPVEVTISYDHALTGEEKSYTKLVESPMFFYLPFNARAHRWRAKVTAISEAARLEIRDIQLAQSPEELV